MDKKLHVNVNTQPVRVHRVFDNWDVVTHGWYIACPSSDIKINEVKSLTLCSQHIVLFRTDDHKIHAMDGYCPHMGVDLGIGKVINNNLQCFFHHWKFNTEGSCVEIPCQKEIPSKAKNRTYHTHEALGFIWVNPSEETPIDFLQIPLLKNKALSFTVDKKIIRTCHHHITMINGIDPQHLKTVHNIDIEMNLEINELNKEEIEISLTGEFSKNNFKDKMMSFFLGKNYSYSMNYQNGTLAALTIMKDVKLYGKYDIIPPLHMYFAYRPLSNYTTEVFPIYVTHKRSGFLGKIKEQLLLLSTRICFKALQGEDGEVYNNIRFNTQSLLAIDIPVTKYIAYINRLTPSVWSKKI